MSTKTTKLKAASANGSSTRDNGKAPNRPSSKAVKRKKSMYDRWIEKYGASESKADRMMLETCKMIHEAHNTPKS